MRELTSKAPGNPAGALTCLTTAAAGSRDAHLHFKDGPVFRRPVPWCLER